MAASKENITVNDFDKICRTCYSSHDLQNIYGLLNSDLISVEFILNKYTEIEFNSTDNLPKQICSKCIENLHKAYTFLNNCDLVNKALIESSARCANYYGDKMHEPSDKIPSCEIKEEPDDTFYSKDPQDDSNTENANDISFATVKVENLHSFIDIKEEPHAIDEIINLVENDCESEDWNMDDDDSSKNSAEPSSKRIKTESTSESENTLSIKSTYVLQKKKNSKMYQCDKCLVYFFRKIQYISHVSRNCDTYNKKNKHFINQPGVSKEPTNATEEYVSECGREERRIKCNTCHIEVHAGYIDKHMSMHNRTQYKCNKCKVCFGSQLFLNGHITGCKKIVGNTSLH